MEIGHVNFEGVKCIFAQDCKTIYLTPENQKDYFELDLLHRHNFFIELFYISDITFACIKNVELADMRSYKLNVDFFIRHTTLNPDESISVSCMEFSGNELDAVFNPMGHYYRLTNGGREKNGTDLLYSKELIDSFSIAAFGKKVSFEVFFGNILSEGLLGDNRLHARLRVSFEQTDEIRIVHQVYLLVVRFLQIMLYQQEIGFQYIKLFNCGEDGSRTFYGYLWAEKNTTLLAEPLRNYKMQRHFQQIFQLLAEDGDIYVKHLPLKQQTFRRFEILDVLTVFAAFESECKKDTSRYIKKPVDFGDVRKELQEAIELVAQKYAEGKYSDYFISVRDRLKTAGLEYGEKQRIINAYNACINVLRNATTGCPQAREVKEVASRIVEMRNKAIHNNLFPGTNEYDDSCIRLLHIICYSMFLKRAEIPDEVVKRTLDDVFHCNDMLMYDLSEPTPLSVDPTTPSTDV